MARRYPIQHVCEPSIHTVQLLLDGTYEVTPDIVCSSKTIYIGAAVSMFDKGILESILDAHLVKGVTYLHHMTTHFCEKGKSIPENTILPGQKLERMINALVIRKSDGAAAFRISTEQGDSLEKTYHITARIPSGLTPVVSNSFVGLTDERVKIIPMTIPVKLTGFWFTN
jgi:hypothetical protein